MPRSNYLRSRTLQRCLNYHTVEDRWQSRLEEDRGLNTYQKKKFHGTLSECKNGIKCGPYTRQLTQTKARMFDVLTKMPITCPYCSMDFKKRSNRLMYLDSRDRLRFCCMLSIVVFSCSKLVDFMSSSSLVDSPDLFLNSSRALSKAVTAAGVATIGVVGAAADIVGYS
jgi:hypothetical protein